jgi:hypothetical protein
LRDSAITQTPEIMKIVEEELRKYNTTSDVLFPKKTEREKYEASLGTSLTGIGATSDMLFGQQKSLYDLSQYGAEPTGETFSATITETLAAIANNTQPILDGGLATDISSGVGKVGETIGAISGIGGKEGALDGLTGVIGQIMPILSIITTMISLFSMFSKRKKMAQGGVVPSGFPNDTYPAMLTSGETVIPPYQLPRMNGGFERQEMEMNVTVEGVVRGKDIYYVVKDVERRMKNTK